MILHQPNTVTFDPSNKNHRVAVASFMQRNAWGDSSYRFTHDPAYGSVAEQVKMKMLHWYIEQDTGITVQSATRPLVSRGLMAVV
jgi:hypothetical protein